MEPNAKLNGRDVAAWLRQTLERLPTCAYSQIDSLLPLRRSPVHASIHLVEVGLLDASRGRSPRLGRAGTIGDRK